MNTTTTMNNAFDGINIEYTDTYKKTQGGNVHEYGTLAYTNNNGGAVKFIKETETLTRYYAVPVAVWAELKDNRGKISDFMPKYGVQVGETAATETRRVVVQRGITGGAGAVIAAAWNKLADTTRAALMKKGAANKYLKAFEADAKNRAAREAAKAITDYVAKSGIDRETLLALLEEAAK